MINIDMELSIIVYCHKCGGDLNAEYKPKSYKQYEPSIMVEPCQQCMQESFTEGQNTNEPKEDRGCQ
jgi:hypothetical protein